MLDLGSGATVRRVVEVRRTKPPGDSRLFEHLNLERMRKLVHSVKLSEQLMEDARQRIEEAHRLIDESRILRSWSDRNRRDSIARRNASKPR